MKKCAKCKQEKPLDEFKFRSAEKYKHKRFSYCKDCVKEYDRDRYKRNAEKYKQAVIAYEEKNKEKVQKRRKLYYKKNLEKLNKKQKEWYSKNREDQIAKCVDRHAKRMEEDTFYKAKYIIRANISHSFKRACSGQFVKKYKTEEILGCTFEDFVSYIVKNFKPGMTIENHGEWHLDHIIPLATAKTEEDILKLCHYSNYKPEWADYNFRKGSKLNYKE